MKDEIFSFIRSKYKGIERDRILQSTRNTFDFERKILATNGNFTFDELLVHMEQCLQLAKDLGGNELVNRYIDHCCSEWQKLSPNTVSDLRRRLEQLRIVSM